MRKATAWSPLVWTSLMVLCLAMFGCGRDEESNCVISVRAGDSLQTAIDRADAGAILCLSAGTWTENVVIAKPLTLRGTPEGQAILRGVDDGYPVVLIEVSNEGELPVVVLENLQILDAQGEACAEFSLRDNREICPYGVLIVGRVDVRILSCTISGNRTGIAAIGSAKLLVSNCIVTNNDWEGIYVAGASEGTIVDSQLRENGSAGIAAAATAVVTIRGCVIEHNTGDGVAVADYAQAAITDCVISGNGWSGVKMISAADVTVESCRIENNTHFGIAPLSDMCYPGEPDYVGSVHGRDNWIPEPGEPGGNAGGALCPAYPGGPWPDGFLSDKPPSTDP